MTGSHSSLRSYGRQHIDDSDIEGIVEVLNSDFLTTGPTVDAFESEFAERVGAQYAVACSSGTAALHLATLALGLTTGDTAVVPSLTFLASANAYRFEGVDVRFADVDENCGLLTPQTFHRALTRTGAQGIKAVTVVHLNGQAAAVEEVAEIAGKFGIQVIEDACHAVGSRFRSADGVQVVVGECRFSAMTVFSFHPVKTMTSAEGGMVCTNSPDLALRLRRARNHGIVREADQFLRPHDALESDGMRKPWYTEMHELGYNYRLSDLQCALGRSQLRKMDRYAEQRRCLMGLYDKGLASMAPRVLPLPRASNGDPVLHLYPVLIDFEALEKERGAVMRELHEHGVGTQVHYAPVHRQPYYRKLYGDIELPGADRYYARILSLPFHVGVTEDDVTFVVRALSHALDL